jgi:hypothetical protein
MVFLPSSLQLAHLLERITEFGGGNHFLASADCRQAAVLVQLAPLK